MKILIIEDEINTSNYLAKLIKEIKPEAEIVAQLQSIKESLAFFRQNPEPDLIFSDIKLLDGVSFEIYKNVEIKSKIIFLTAFEDYILDSFDYNNVFYLIKPIGKKDLVKAFAKYDKIISYEQPVDINKILEKLGVSESKKTSRIVIECDNNYIPVEVKDILLIESDFKNSVVYLAEGKKYPCNMNLKRFEEILKPDQFIRISRQWIVNSSAIMSISKSLLGKPKIILKPGCCVREIEFSKEKLDMVLASL